MGVKIVVGKDAPSIEKAIEMAHRCGGGSVHLPPGRYDGLKLYVPPSVVIMVENGVKISNCTIRRTP